jgi:WD40 repeat protein/DNA-binding SARP family transcriptional activator/energy-coupling factor transporter ATP-binding protein EcfA2
MLEVRLLGQFDVRKNGSSILIPSRPAQSLLAYLLLTPGTAHRREKLSGLLWGDSSEANARSNLRQALWRVRKALDSNPNQEQTYVLSDQYSVAFNPNSDYWLDAAVLEKQAKATTSSDRLMDLLSLYRGELLPGFYDDWAMLERERLQAVFERDVERLLELLRTEQRWTEMLEWGERWIAYGQRPEPAYRALMIAHGALGNRSRVAYIYDRCVKALRDDLGVEPSEITQKLFAQLAQGPYELETALKETPTPPASGHRSAPDRPPYKGLLHFEEEDARLFCGREELTAHLVSRLQQERFLVLVGASGSGKSSLLRAGLVPAIKGANQPGDHSSPSDDRKSQCVQVITPTARPLEALGATLARISDSAASMDKFRHELEHDPNGFMRVISEILPPGARFVLIVDQFEELFTLCDDSFEREAFVDHILATVSGESTAKIQVVLALRADFYTHCAQYDTLRQALVEHQEYLGPMGAAELRRAIEEPARQGDWMLEPGLVDLMLGDTGDEPGGLPLLSHALLETWNRRSGQALTLKGYTDSGGVRGAISHTAEMVFQELIPEQQEIARYIFLHLVELGDNTADTRRSVARQDIIAHNEDTDNIQAVLNILAERRLITLGEEMIDVAHEALIRTWGRLRTWLDDSRDTLRLRRRLTIVANEWVNAGREASYLAGGARLSQFEALAGDADIKLGSTELAYLQASLTEREKQQAQERLRLAHEASLEQRSRNIWRILVIVLLLATIGALALTALAWGQSRVARRNELATKSLALNSGSQFALSQGDSELALALALAASQIDPSNVQAQLTLSDLAYASGMQRRLVGNMDRASAVAFAPDGKHALSAAWDKSLVLWNLASRQQVRRFAGHTGPVLAVAFSPDGKTALSGSADTSLILWEVASGKAIRRFEDHAKAITSVAFSPDGRLALSGSEDQSLILWDLATGKIIHRLSGHTGKVNSAAFSPDGAMIVSGASDNQLILWDVASGSPVRSFGGHTDAVTAVAFNPDGKTLLSGSLDKTLILWDIASGEPVRHYAGHLEQVNALAFSPDGKTAISADGSQELLSPAFERVLILWEIATGRALQRFEGHTAPIVSVAFSTDGKTILSGSADTSLIVWRPASGAEVQRFEGHASAVNAVATSPDGKLTLSGSADGALILWEAATGKPIRQISGGSIINALAISPDGQSAISGSTDGQLTIWSLETGQALGSLTGHSGSVTSVSLSPDGKTALSGSLDRTLILWDIASGQALRHFIGHTNVVNSVAIRGDGKRALSGSYDRTFILWDIDSGKALYRSPVQASILNSVAFSPDGKAGLAGGADGSLILFDLQRGTELRRFTGHSAPVNTVAFSPDGSSLLSGSMDHTLILWDVASGQPIRRFLGHTGSIRTVTFSPDGRTALSASSDKSLRLWRIDSLADLIAWTETNRNIIELPCEQRAFYRLEPLCTPNTTPSQTP